ncbi:MAG: response regulator [Chloroflexi bacterium]|nr:response regulator [Chloroflexota bacterium]
MTPPAAPNPEAAALHAHISGLTAAILRIGESPDIPAVLREVVESAPALTGARCGVIATLGEDGMPLDVATAGFAAEEEPAVAGRLPDARPLFEQLGALEAPLSLPDLPDHARALELPADPAPCAFLGAPMRHRGERAGVVFLVGKDDQAEFTDEDAELLVLFAAQAAAAVANARAHRAERRAWANFETLVETAPVGVVVFDAKTAAMVLANREALRITEPLGDPGDTPMELSKRVIPRYASGREVTVEQLVQREELRAAEMELAVPDGRSVRVLLNATPIRSPDGEIESMVVAIQDMAPFEELQRLRVEFLAMVSHELRAPLTSIKGATATLLDATRALDRAELRQFHRIIATQSDHMERLVSDLLDAGRIESGTLSVDPEPMQVAALVEQARTTYLSGGTGQAMRIDLPEDLPPVMADERRIAQVLNNLFSNAARHAPESTPIHVSAIRDRIEVVISVADEGPGIAPDQLPHLFRKYADFSDRDREHQPAGFGLGLVICKGLVEAHGGRIHAESAGPGMGTRFTFTLPVAGETAEPVSGRLAGGPRTSHAGREAPPVLVVDDDPEMLRYVRDTLTEAGYAPAVTGDPEEVAGLIRARKPHLVLLDLKLPGTDGIELMERIPELADLPVIFISGYGRDETIARALEAGAADYIVKPFSPTELTARVRAALRRKAEPDPFVLGELAIDYERRRVSVAGNPVRLTAREYELLRVLSVNAGRVVTYATLLRQVWENGDRDGVEPVRDFVKKLRRKLGDDAANPRYIANERGVGYRMRMPDEA